MHPEIALVALVFVLGLKHGLDPDHLVAIDGLARPSRDTRMRRWTGLFFSLGHGLVVTLASAAFAVAAAGWQPPSWLEIFGALVSIAILLGLGAANLAASLRAGEGGRPVGVRGRWIVDRMGAASHPVVIAAIGATFAVSFDTLSHALLLSSTGVATAIGLGATFTLGMVLTDALNGLWVARMAGASRFMAIAIAGLCFAIAAIGVAKLARPGVAEAMGAAAPLVGLGTLGVIVAAWLARRRATIAFRI